MSRTGRILLGVATAVQLVATWALLWVKFDVVLGFLVLVLQSVLAIVYFVDVGRNERVPGGTEKIWRWAILLLGPLAEPVYFWYFLYGEGG